MQTDEMRALAERVMRFDGPSRETDAEVARAFGFGCVARDSRACGDGWTAWRGKHFRSGPWEPLKYYTASLDAAMTLGSNFLLVAMSDIAADGLPGVCLCSDTSTTPPREHWGIALNRGENETRQQVLARCYTAAALLARAAQMETTDETE